MHPGRRHGALRLHPGPLVRRLLQRGHQQVAVSTGRCGRPNPHVMYSVTPPPRHPLPSAPDWAAASAGFPRLLALPAGRRCYISSPARPGLRLPRRTWEGRGRRNREARGRMRTGGLWLPGEGLAYSRSRGRRFSARALELRAGLLPGGKPCVEQPGGLAPSQELWAAGNPRTPPSWRN